MSAGPPANALGIEVELEEPVLDGVWPNPTKGNGVHVAFALRSGAAARIELLDVSGHRVPGARGRLVG